MVELDRDQYIKIVNEESTREFPVEERSNDLENQYRKETQLLKEREDIIEMRRRWSNWLLWCIIGIVIFDAVFISALGLQIISFKDMKVVLTFVITNLTKIAGLALIVVLFLFDKQSIR